MTTAQDLATIIGNLDDKQLEVVANVALSISAAKSAEWSGNIRFEVFVRKGLSENIKIGSDRSVQLGNGCVGVFFCA